MNTMSSSNKPPNPQASFGWCNSCKTEHRLGAGNATEHALALMQSWTKSKRIDYLNDDKNADPIYSTDYLFGDARGQMFGVMECSNAAGEIVILRAFSCQYNGKWELEGWVPPLFDVDAFDRIMIPGDRKIKELGRQIDSQNPGDEHIVWLKQKRKNLSQVTMKALHNLYELRNFNGETKPLAAFFKDTNGIPTGAGDCCAPKLLNYAARNNLRPLGIAEFYWGKANHSNTREHGQFYSCCAGKCQPILGFMLCGVE